MDIIGKLLFALATTSIVGSSMFAFTYLWMVEQDTNPVAIEQRSQEPEITEPDTTAIDITELEATEPETPEQQAQNTDDPWVTGIEYATKAAELTQTANSRSEWDTVTRSWDVATSSMAQVPSTHPNYAIAQQKVEEYRRNQRYARDQVAKFLRQTEAEQQN